MMADHFEEIYAPKLASKSVLAPNGACILWTGTQKKCRAMYYGVMCCRVPPDQAWKTLYVHRMALIFDRHWSLDDIDQPGMHASHLCHNPLCVKPLHIEYEPQHVNLNRINCVNRGTCQKHGEYRDCMLLLKKPIGGDGGT